MSWGGIMEVIAASIISAVASIIILTITIHVNSTANRTLAKNDQKLNSCEHNKLSKEHEQLSKEHGNLERSLGKDIREITKTLAPIGTTGNSIRDMLIEEKTRQSDWHSNLSEDQRNMKAHLDELNKMASDWQRVISENKGLQIQVKELRRQVNELKKEIARPRAQERGTDSPEYSDGLHQSHQRSR